MTPALQGWKSDTKSGGLGHCNYSYTCTPIQIYVRGTDGAHVHAMHTTHAERVVGWGRAVWCGGVRRESCECIK